MHLQRDRKTEYIIHREDIIYFFLQFLNNFENNFEAVVFTFYNFLIKITSVLTFLSDGEKSTVFF